MAGNVLNMISGSKSAISPSDYLYADGRAFGYLSDSSLSLRQHRRQSDMYASCPYGPSVSS